LGSLSEPHRKRNLYANPKRTAKSSITTSDAGAHKKVQNNIKKLRAPHTKIDT